MWEPARDRRDRRGGNYGWLLRRGLFRECFPISGSSENRDRSNNSRGCSRLRSYRSTAISRVCGTPPPDRPNRNWVNSENYYDRYNRPIELAPSQSSVVKEILPNKQIPLGIDTYRFPGTSAAFTRIFVPSGTDPVPRPVAGTTTISRFHKETANDKKGEAADDERY